MPEPRKIFRIEETTAARLDGHDAGVPEPREPLRHAELMTEIAGLRAMVAAMAQPHVFNGEARNGDTARLNRRPKRRAAARRRHGADDPHRP